MVEKSKKKPVNFIIAGIFSIGIVIALAITILNLIQAAPSPTGNTVFENLVKEEGYQIAKPFDSSRWEPGTIFSLMDERPQPYSILKIKNSIISGDRKDYKLSYKLDLSSNISASPSKSFILALQSAGVTVTEITLSGLHTKFYYEEDIKNALRQLPNIESMADTGKYRIILDVLVANDLLVSVKGAKSTSLTESLKKAKLSNQYDFDQSGYIRSKKPLVVGYKSAIITKEYRLTENALDLNDLPKGKFVALPASNMRFTSTNASVTEKKVQLLSDALKNSQSYEIYGQYEFLSNVAAATEVSAMYFTNYDGSVLDLNNLKSSFANGTWQYKYQAWSLVSAPDASPLVFNKITPGIKLLRVSDDLLQFED